MKFVNSFFLNFWIACIGCFVMISSNAQNHEGRFVTSFDNDWKFFRPLPFDTTEASSISWADSSWSMISLPHDWSIEGPYNNAFPSGSGGGYLPMV